MSPPPLLPPPAARATVPDAVASTLTSSAIFRARMAASPNGVMSNSATKLTRRQHGAGVQPAVPTPMLEAFACRRFPMLFRKSPEMPTPDEALPGRAHAIPTADTHFVNGHPL